MKKSVIFTSILLLIAFQAYGETTPMRVLSDRVNLRAAPQMTAEVVAQVNENDILQAKSVDEEWVEVVPPENVDCWIHREFYIDGRVSVKKLNVRAGPGINYKIVGEMRRNDPVEVRGEFGEWIKIAPIPTFSVWVSKAYVEPARPGNREAMGEAGSNEQYRPQPEPEQVAWKDPRDPAVTRSTPQTAEPGVMRVRPKPQVQRSVPLPPDWKLIPLEGQGKIVEQEGILKTVGFMIKRPTRYRLVHYDNGRTEVICYVWGNETQMEGYLGRTLQLKGRQYWVHGYRSPILVVEQVTLPSVDTPVESVPMDPVEPDAMESTPSQPYN